MQKQCCMHAVHAAHTTLCDAAGQHITPSQNLLLLRINKPRKCPCLITPTCLDELLGSLALGMAPAAACSPGGVDGRLHRLVGALLVLLDADGVAPYAGGVQRRAVVVEERRVEETRGVCLHAGCACCMGHQGQPGGKDSAKQHDRHVLR